METPVAILQSFYKIFTYFKKQISVKIVWLNANKNNFFIYACKKSINFYETYFK